MINVFHLTSPELEMLIGYVLQLIFYRKKINNLSHVAPKVVRFESSWLRHVRTIAR